MGSVARGIVASLFVVVGVGLCVLALRSLYAEIAFATFQRECKRLALKDTLRGSVEDYATILDESVDAISLEPGNVPALQQVSGFFLDLACQTSDPVCRLRFADASFQNSRKAVAAAPTSHVAWADLAQSLQMLGLDVQAEFCYVRASQLAPYDAGMAGGFRLYASK